jgi:hypothetical protein
VVGIAEGWFFSRDWVWLDASETDKVLGPIDLPPVSSIPSNASNAATATSISTKTSGNENGMKQRKAPIKH